MRGAARTWLRYAEENLRSARRLLAHGLLHPCLQNAPQAVEKSLKAVLIARAIPVHRTHSLQELANLLAANGLPSGIAAEECHLLEAIQLPSK
jgi:HEPN domain-containing protein